jgi:hypothetical protein
LFKLPEHKAIYSLHLDGRNVFPPPVLSPDGKYFVVEDLGGFYFYEAMTGNPAGTISFPVTISEFTASNTLVLFSADGKRLARSYAHGIQLFSLEKAPQVTADFLFPGDVNSHKKALWVSPGYMLVSDRYLIDLERQIVLWQYDLPAEGRAAVFGDRTFVFTADRTKTIGSFVNSIRSYLLPDEKVIQTANTLDPKTLFVTQPGDKVTLKVQVGQAEAAKRLTEHFTRELADKGYVLADNAPLKLEVSIGDFNTKSVAYRVAGRPGGEKATVTNKKMGVQFVLDGKVIWEAREFSGAPQVLHMKRGESIDGAIKEHQSNDWHQLEAVSLPRQVPAPRDPPGYGRTDLGGEGDTKPRHRVGNR